MALLLKTYLTKVNQILHGIFKLNLAERLDEMNLISEKTRIRFHLFPSSLNLGSTNRNLRKKFEIQRSFDFIQEMESLISNQDQVINTAAA